MINEGKQMASCAVRMNGLLAFGLVMAAVLVAACGSAPTPLLLFVSPTLEAVPMGSHTGMIEIVTHLPTPCPSPTDVPIVIVTNVQPTVTPSPTATLVSPTPTRTPDLPTVTLTVTAVPMTVTKPMPTPTIHPAITMMPTPASMTCSQGCVTPPPGCLIKGNISSSGEKIYHLPGQRNYEATIIEPAKGERWFCTEEEAIANGWRKAKN